MHAVGFSVLLSAYFAQVMGVVWSFTALVALSRVVLGLHYPSDVLAGAILGSGYAAGGLWGAEWLWQSAILGTEARSVRQPQLGHCHAVLRESL